MVNYCLALPIVGEMELVKKFAQEYGGHTKEYDEFYNLVTTTLGAQLTTGEGNKCRVLP
jgi:hypothetical protein